MSLAAGTHLGAYEILDALGAGGMGEVYKARDTRLGREVAIKVIPEEFFEDKDRKERFEREARTLASLNHPSIASIHSFEEVPGSSPSAARHLLVMEFLEGTTLRERLDEGALPPRRAIDLAVQIAHGLSAAHEKGIVHRDLKPENVFVTKEGRVKILDFGLAKLTQPEGTGSILTQAPTTPPATAAGVVMGTVGYMSPEQVRGEIVDHRSDIFSLGVILYEALSGKRAFHGETAVETLHAILKDDPPELTGTDAKIPVSLARIVHRCLEKQPAERLQSARDVAFALEAVSGTSRTGPIQPLDAPRVAALRTRLIATVLAVAVAAAGGYVVAKRSHKQSIPTTRKITFRRGDLAGARFTPDGQSVVYGAAWDGKPMEVFSTRLDGAESRPLGLPRGDVLAVSSAGKLALSLGRNSFGRGSLAGTLAEVPLGGSAPREILADVRSADYNADGSRLVVMHREKEKFRLEYPVGTLLYESSNYILFPRISPSGDLIAFFEREEPDWTLAVVDLSGKRQVLSRNWIGGPEGGGLAWFPGTDQLWFAAGSASAGNALYSVVPGKKEELRWRSADPFYLQDISKDGRFLLSILTSRVGIACLPPGENQEGDLSWFDDSEVQDLSRDGTRLLFHESSGGESARGIYLRKTDGSSPAVRLGEGGPERAGSSEELSPDGLWVLFLHPSASTELKLLPTGVGSRKIVKLPGIACDSAAWHPDGKRVIAECQEKGHGWRLYVQRLEGGDSKAITLEGIQHLGPVSPDGSFVLGYTDDGKWFRFPVEGGTPLPVPGLDADDRPNIWSADGQTLYVHQHKPPNLALFRFDLRTGRKELWKEIRTPDPAATSIHEVVVATDGRTYAYSYVTRVSSLYLLERLK